MIYSMVNNLPLRHNNNSYWFSNDKLTYRKYLHIELKIRKILDKYLKKITDIVCTNINIEIIRIRDVINLKINMFICKCGKKFDKNYYVDTISRLIRNNKYSIKIEELMIDMQSVNKYMLHAAYIAKVVSLEMARRITIRKLSRIAEQVILEGAIGCIIEIKGRINGYEISRQDRVIKGKIGRHVLTNDIDFIRYSHVSSKGCIGIKVWVNRGQLPNYKSYKNVNDNNDKVDDKQFQDSIENKNSRAKVAQDSFDDIENEDLEQSVNNPEQNNSDSKKPQQETKPVQSVKDAKPAKEPKSAKEPKLSKDNKDTKNAKTTKEPKSVKSPKESKMLKAGVIVSDNEKASSDVVKDADENSIKDGSEPSEESKSDKKLTPNSENVDDVPST